jgi:peptidoglycan/xylan/chitin deacetylase (PgdA/CDA1 family)
MGANRFRIPILTYHSLDTSGSVISTAPEKFREQMLVLKKIGYRTVTLKDVVEHIRDQMPLPDRSVAITFDDGFKNFHTVAYPLLKELNFTATVFLIPGYCGKNNQWPGQTSGIPILDLLTWDEIGALANDGFELGNHTMNHGDLSQISYDEGIEEILRAKEKLQSYTSLQTFFFAYPYGRYTQRLKQALSVHFSGACGTKLGFASSTCDIYALPRIDMYYFSRNKFFFSLDTMFFPWYINLRRALRYFRRHR